MNTPDSGVLDVNGITAFYMTADQERAPQDIKYVDVFGLLELINRLCFDQISKTLRPRNILLHGPKGVGKSLLFAYFARRNDIPYFSLDCSEETKRSDIRGGFVPKDGTTPFVLGTVSNAVHIANRCGMAMLVLEELNALSPQRQKDLNSVLDFRRKVEVPELRTRFALEPHAKLWVGATMNPSAHGGVYDLNEDLRSRFKPIEVPYPAPGMEKRILRESVEECVHLPDDALDKLILIAQQSRQDATGYALSTRDLADTVLDVLTLGWDDALFMLSQRFEGEERKLMADRIRDITKVSIHADLSARASAMKGMRVP